MSIVKKRGFLSVNGLAILTAFAAGEARACMEQIAFSKPVPGAVATTQIVHYSVNGRDLAVTDDDGVFMTMLAYQYAAYEPIPPENTTNVVDEPYQDWEKTKTKSFAAWNGPLGESLRASLQRTLDYYQGRAAAHPDEKPGLDRTKATVEFFKDKKSITYDELSKIGAYLDEEAKVHGYTVKEGDKEGYYALVENNSFNPIGSSFINFMPYKFPPEMRSRCPAKFTKRFADLVATGGGTSSGGSRSTTTTTTNGSGN